MAAPCQRRRHEIASDDNTNHLSNAIQQRTTTMTSLASLLIGLLVFHSESGFVRAFRSSANDVNNNDRIATLLPGYHGEPLCWNHSAGHLNAGDDRRLFHWHHEAVENPSQKPLILWLNGGPGCSSLGGMFTELGPFVLDRNLNITLNPHSFNRVANMLFLEQPTGVGFSHPNVPANDTSTAADTDLALQSFFWKHPELRNRAFCVLG